MSDGKSHIAPLRDELQAADLQRKLYLLSVLSHNVTVGVRVMLTDTLPHKDKLYALNQIQHQITARLMNLLDGEDEWDESAFAEDMFDYAIEGNCTGELVFAIQQTLRALRHEVN